MNNEKVAVIIGAGPAGLSLAYELIEKNSDIKPVIIEKLPCVGGLSRTVYFDNLGVEIGPHRLHTKDEYLKSVWEKMLPFQNAPAPDDIYAKRNIKYPEKGLDPNTNDNVMLIKRRFSTIIYNKKLFPYPIKLNFNIIKKLGFLTTIKAGFSYIKSMFFKLEENCLENFMVNRFGRVLYNIFFKDYTTKVWGVSPKILSAEWGSERIRKLSLLKTVMNAILSNFKFIKFQKEASLIDQFYYPKFGCSQLWNTMADYIVQHGGEIIYNSEFVDFDTDNGEIKSMHYKNNGEIKEIKGDYYISSIAISDLIKGFSNPPQDVKEDALNLPYRDHILVSFYTTEFNIENTTDFPTPNNKAPDSWIYLQEPDALAARFTIVNNWSPWLVGDFKTNYLLSLEYFTNEGDDFWNKSDDEIIEIAKTECLKYNICRPNSILKTHVIREHKAYPSYWGTYKNINRIKEYFASFRNLRLMGRNGIHRYNNMDTAMISGINVAREIANKTE